MERFEVSLEGVFERVRSVWEKREAVLNVYLWGSRVYGLVTPTSDWDFQFVVEDGADVSHNKKEVSENLGQIEKTYFVFDDGVINVKFVPKSDFEAMVLEHQHEALECIFLEDQYKLKESVSFELPFDGDVLRRTVGWESKRRFTRSAHTFRKSPTKGKKEIIHSIRYLLLAIQILQTGRIYDYKCANQYFHQIMSESESNYKYYSDKYGAIRKNFSTQLAEMRAFNQFLSRLELRRVAMVKERRRYIYKEAFETKIFSKQILEPKEVVHDSVCETVNWIRANGIAYLLQHHKVTFVRHSKHKNLIYFTSNRFVDTRTVVEMECYNGLLIDENDNFKIINWPFVKFIDFLTIPNESVIASNTPFDWNNFVTTEKLDGLFVSLYYYQDEWHTSSYGYPSKPEIMLCKHVKPKNPVDNSDERPLHEIFWEIWNKNNYQLPQKTDVCFVFELVSNTHRFMVNNKEDDLYLIGARDLGTLKELPFHDLSQFNYKTPNTHNFTNPTQIIEVCQTLNPFQGRGFVVIDPNSRRFSFSSKKWISASYGSDLSNVGGMNLLGGMDPKIMFELIKNNKSTIFLAYYPEWTQYHQQINQDHTEFTSTLQLFFDHFHSVNPAMDKYCEAIDFIPEISAPLRKMRMDSQLTIQEYLATLLYKAVGFSKPFTEFTLNKPKILQKLENLKKAN